MDKFVVRRLAVGFGLLGFTSSIGAVANGYSPVGSGIMILISFMVLMVAHD